MSKPRRHLTASGRFEVISKGGGKALIHAHSGLTAGGFSHLAVRTFRQALDGVEQAEKALSADHLTQIDAMRDGAEATPESRAAQLALIAALREAFPDGAWSPGGCH